MKNWMIAGVLALMTLGPALAQMAPPGGGGPGGGPPDGPPPGPPPGSPSRSPQAAPSPARDHEAFEIAWAQCHIDVDLAHRVACYERLHDEQEAALQQRGGPPPHNAPRNGQSDHPPPS